MMDEAVLVRPRVRSRYVAIALTALKQATAYPRTVALNLAAGLVTTLLLYHVWEHSMPARLGAAGMDWSTMRMYLALSFALNSLLAFPIELQTMATIRSGSIALELVRPASYQASQLAQAVGIAAIEGLGGGLLCVALAFGMGGAQGPASAWHGLGFGLSAILGFIIRFQIGYLTSLLCVWTINGVGLLWVRTAISNILSGALVPLPLLPGPLEQLARFGPFQATVYTPVRIYLGAGSIRDQAAALAIQLAWVVVLWASGRLLWRSSSRELAVQGG
jgi:ABC-2 type transport system permease protein